MSAAGALDLKVPETLDEATRAKRILVVDDDPDILEVVRYTLEARSFEVSIVGSAKEAFAWMEEHGLPHLAVVDIMMPGTGGIELSREIHRFSDLPIVMLTAVDDEETVVNSLDEIAEDYVTKPFSPRELAARVSRVLRRVGDFAFRLGSLTPVDDWLAVDFLHKRVVVGGRNVSLTPTETKILHILMSHSGRTVSHEHLLGRVWPVDEVYEDTLRVHVHRLRQKVEPDPSAPRYLVTQRGRGYCFLPNP